MYPKTPCALSLSGDTLSRSSPFVVSLSNHERLTNPAAAPIRCYRAFKNTPS